MRGNPGQDDGIARNGCIRTTAFYDDVHETFRLRATGAPRMARADVVRIDADDARRPLWWPEFCAGMAVATPSSGGLALFRPWRRRAGSYTPWLRLSSLGELVYIGSQISILAGTSNFQIPKTSGVTKMFFWLIEDALTETYRSRQSRALAILPDGRRPRCCCRQDL